MKLCIAEKPSVAKEIASIIGANTKKDGYFEGNGYWVSWTFGHLCTLKEPHDYTSIWKWWNLATLPMIPSRFSIKVMEDQGVQKQFRTIKTLVEKCDEVINCGDAGQEGELIQQWVLLKAKNDKPVKRLWISSLTEEAIQEGFENLRDGKDFLNLYAAGSSRAIGDWLLGMNATRLYTLKFGQERQVLSIGRVQTPTLAMIVERQLEIDNFKSEKYWELKTVYREVLFSATLGRLKSEEKGKSAIEYVKDKEFEVKSYEQKEGKEQPPRLFDLTSLQVEANNKFAFSADLTLKLVQSLYEKKLVTYPRVDTTYLSEDIYPKVPKILQGLTYFSKLTEPLLGKEIRKSKKVFDDKKITDHHAIIPTGITPSGITADEQKIYNTIAKRFISVFYPDCTVSNTTVLGMVEKVEFKATGKQIIEAGWREVYTTDNNKGNNEENIMPEFVEGEKGPHEPEIQEKETRPPKYYTEATLLRAMETAGKNVDDEELRDAMKENGIGRPSTRANIIETLFRRRYIEKKKKNIHATVTGIELIKTIKSDLLKSPELTGQWEFKLRQIEKGEYQVDEFKKELIEMVVDITNHVKLAEDKVIPLAKPKKPKKESTSIDEMQCPKCKEGTLVKGKSAYGCSAYKEGCSFVVPFTIMGKKLTSKQLADLLSKSKTGSIKGFQIPGSEEKKNGKLIFTSDFNIELEE
ncbi:DNA topoisomerase 3 [Paracrocinitomix mangrovi]|uniref:type IA DNA topoisomerase n=1 Tax=Paracrocinitomix mangrovi TaxID=2862509 RepID=UPI001C8E1842|nr:type IA DNA topoisomerase [Paracrocinitomix mangrovi]UKN00544.1 DNA topoisomerase 3 [Paracrocinitomix mangrovi]